MKKLLKLLVVVCMVLVANVSWAQQNKVTGKVTDQEGVSLPGVTVIIKGTQNGTVSDNNGQYSIDATKGAVLIFSFVGMISHEVLIEDQTEINVSLKTETIGIEEVVAIGYGTAKKSEVTGAVGFAGGEELKKQPSFNAFEKLRGKIAGVNIFTNSGSPTGENNIIIRGIGTINASSKPLYVVDGIQMTDITYMNPNSIKSMEVLKDASSAAIYGARGANGVILITTEGGATKQGLTVNILTELSIGEMMERPNSEFNPMNAAEFMEVQRKAFENAPVFADYPTGQEPKLSLNFNTATCLSFA